MKKIKGALLRRNCMLGDLGRRLHLSEDLKVEKELATFFFFGRIIFFFFVVNFVIH